MSDPSHIKSNIHFNKIVCGTKSLIYQGQNECVSLLQNSEADYMPPSGPVDPKCKSQERK